jgi:hypothetical protein
MPLVLNQHRHRVALAGLLAVGLAIAFTQPGHGEARSPQPPPGPYNSMTFVDIPVEEAEGLNFPPLDYGQSLEASQIPDRSAETSPSEYPETLPAEPAGDESGYPPLEEPVGSEQIREPLLPKDLAREPVDPEPDAGGPSISAPGDSGQAHVPATSVDVPGRLEPAAPEGAYPPLEADEPAAPQGAPSQGREPVPKGQAGVAATPRGEDRPQTGASTAPTQQAEPPASVGTAPRPAPGYGYPGYQAPQPYYPRGGAWGQAPGAMGVPPQPRQGPGGSLPQGQAPQGRSAPGYPGMYYPPGGYAPYYPPNPAQGSVSGGQR